VSATRKSSSGRTCNQSDTPREWAQPYSAAQGSAEDKGGFIDRYRYGIKIVIQASGVISKTDIMYLVNAVIQGMVLLNVAGGCTYKFNPVDP
jgi:hypothetical protein